MNARIISEDCISPPSPFAVHRADGVPAGAADRWRGLPLRVQGPREGRRDVSTRQGGHRPLP